MLPAAPWGLNLFFVVLPVIVVTLMGTAVLWTMRRDGCTGRPWNRALILVVLLGGSWLVAAAALGASGVLRDFSGAVPTFMRPFGVILAALTGLAFSPVGTGLIRHLPIAAIIALQGFRLPLELAMHRAAHLGVMPAQMSYAGWNFDIVTGCSALVVAALVYRRPSVWLVAVWNTVGSALLLTIMAIAIASTPRFHAFGTDPAVLNTWVLYAPFSLLPYVLVPAAFVGHLLVWRWLAAQRRLPAAKPASR